MGEHSRTKNDRRNRRGGGAREHGENDPSYTRNCPSSHRRSVHSSASWQARPIQQHAWRSAHVCRPRSPVRPLEITTLYTVDESSVPEHGIRVHVPARLAHVSHVHLCFHQKTEHRANNPSPTAKRMRGASSVMLSCVCRCWLDIGGICAPEIELQKATTKGGWWVPKGEKLSSVKSTTGGGTARGVILSVEVLGVTYGMWLFS